MFAKTAFFLCAACALVTGAPSHEQSQQTFGSRQQVPIVIQSSGSFQRTESNGEKVPGESPAYYCDDSDPADNILKITHLDFLPTNPRVGFYQKIRIIGTFLQPTGDVPWMTVNATYLDEDLPGNNPFFYGPLCDIDVFQKLSVPIPDKLGGGRTPEEMFRSCPSGIREGYAVITSWPIPLWPGYVPVGWYRAQAEAVTQDGRRIFCVEGTFEVTK